MCSVTIDIEDLARLRIENVQFQEALHLIKQRHAAEIAMLRSQSEKQLKHQHKSAMLCENLHGDETKSKLTCGYAKTNAVGSGKFINKLGYSGSPKKT